MSRPIPLDPAPARELMGDPAEHATFVRARVRDLSSNSSVMDAEDIEQEGWLALVLCAKKWRQGFGASLQTYAYRRVRGRAMDEIRTQNHSRRHYAPTFSLDTVQEEGLRIIDDDAVIPAEAVVEQEEREQVIAAVRQAIADLPLPERDIAAILLRGGGAPEIRAELGYSPRKARLLREGTLSRLRDALAAYAAGDDASDQAA